VKRQRGWPLPVRLYRWFLGRAPGELGGRYADDATVVFLEQYRETVRRRGRVGALRLVLRSMVLLAAVVLRERREAKGSNPKRKRERMSAFVGDVRFSMRALLKRPAFSVTAVLILAAGIGATTTIFSVVDTVVLREMPYPNAGRLVFFDNGSFSFPDFRSWQELSAFESIGAAFDQPADLSGDGAPERLQSVSVSPRFFSMLGAAPAMGRLLVADDFHDGSNVVVLGYGTWQRRWGGRADVVGSTQRINGHPMLVVGVLAESFDPPQAVVGSRVDLWMPLGSGGEMANERRFHILSMVGRLAPGTSIEVAQQEIDAQRTADAEAFPEQYRRRNGTIQMVPLIPLREATVSRVQSTLFALLGAVALLLFIACANVANLFLARGTSRTREIALRSALGASRWRVATQVLTEGVLLALVGGAIGVILSLGGVAAFRQFNPGEIPRLEHLAVDPRILGFSLLVSMGTAILFGALPAVQAARANVGDALKEGAAAVTTSRRGRKARNGLVVTEIALAVVLMTGAGLLFRTFIAMLQVDPGFQTQHLDVLQLRLETGFDEQRRVRFTEELLDGIRRIPGVTHAAGGATIPFSRTGNSRCCWSTTVTGDPALVDEANPPRIMVQPVTDAFLSTFAPAFSGRDFRGDDGPLADIAILNASAARTLFGNEAVIGRQIRMQDALLTVVGVEDDLHYWGLEQPAGNTVYVPHARYGGMFPMLDIAVRSELPLEALAPSLRDVVWRLEPDLPIDQITTMEERVSQSVATPRFLALLFGFFAAVSLLLACAGIYSSMLYTVGQRTREMGIRLALGARGGEIVGMILRSGLLISFFGIAIGTASALAASSFIASILWNVPTTDPLTYAIAAAILGSSAILACLVPALKAARADPMGTLRAD
jgi:putative ABC transport system permease protein